MNASDLIWMLLRFILITLVSIAVLLVNYCIIGFMLTSLFDLGVWLIAGDEYYQKYKERIKRGVIK